VAFQPSVVARTGRGLTALPSHLLALTLRLDQP
jgi:hypothetical protein